MTCVALRITSAARAAHRVEQLARATSPSLHVDLEPGRAHGLEPAVGERFGDEDACAIDRVDAIAVRTGSRSSARPSRSAMRRDALAEVVVAERERQPRVAGRAERLAGHDRDLGLVEQQLAQLERGRAACGPPISRPSTPSNDGKQ